MARRSPVRRPPDRDGSAAKQSPSALPERSRRRLTVRALLLLACLAFLALHIRFYWPYVADDALISLRYADRFLHGHGLTWTDGPRVEGYSNLGWILAVSALGALGVDLVLAARALGIVLMASVPIMLFFGRWTSERASLPAATIASLIWCGTASVAVWAQGGLETPLVAASLAACLLVSLRLDTTGSSRARDWLVPSVLLGVLSLTRPDGFLFAAVFATWLCAVGRLRRDAIRRAMVLLMVPVLVVTAQLAFRLAYYGDWIPNTARVKIAGTGTYIANGLSWVGQGLFALMPLSALCTVGLVLLVRDAQRRRSGILLLLTGAAWIGYVIFIGGDAPRAFPAWRHLLPFIVVMVVTALLGTDRMFDRGAFRQRSTRFKSLAVIFCLASLGVYSYLQFTNSGSRNAILNRDVAWWGKRMGDILRRGFGDKQPLLGVSGAGAVPYWSRLPCVDLLGLNDHYLARNKPTGFGSTIALGHELGDPAYLLRRQPDLLHWGLAWGTFEPWGPIYKALSDMPEYTEAYQPCTFRLDGHLTGQVLVNRNSAKIGIVRDSVSVCIPSYFFDYYTDLDAENRFFVRLDGQAIQVQRIDLEAGFWEIHELPAEVRVQLTSQDSTKIFEGTLHERRVVRVPNRGRYDVLLYTPSGVSGTAHGLCLRRAAPLDLR